jgi:predicted transposase YdaD
MKRSCVEGEELGKEIGNVKKAIEIAVSLEKMGLSNEQISEATGLSADEINAL